MIRITAACILATVARLCLANFYCGDASLDAVDVTATVSPELVVVNGFYRIVAAVNWNVSNLRDVTLHGFAVKVEPLNSNGIIPVSLPLDLCNSGINYIWIITEDTKVCEAGPSNCSLTDTVENACLCSRNNCAALASSANCSEFWESGQARFDYTVLPTTRSLRIPIEFEGGYNISVMPYYVDSGTVGVSRSTAALNGVSGCDEEVFGKIRDEVIGRACVDLHVVDSENLPVNDVITYVIEFKTTVNGSVLHNINSTHHPDNSSLRIHECGLDHCQEYHITVYTVSGGDRVEMIPTFIHTTSSPFEDGSLIAPLTPTTVSTTTIGTTPAPTTPEETQSTRASTDSSTTDMSATAEISTPSGFLCSLTQEINNFTFPTQQPGLVSYSLEKCPSDGATSRASISCLKELEIYDLATFQISTCESIDDIVSQNFTNTTLEKLQISTANVTILTPENVTAVTELFANISNLNQSFSEKEVGEAAEIASHVTEFFSQDQVEENNKEKQNLVQSLNRISRKIDFNFTATPSVTKLTNYVNIEVSEIPRSRNTDYEFNATFYDTKDSSATFNPISIRVPAEALNIVEERQSSVVRVVSVGFRSSPLFPSDRTSDWVISSELGDAVNVVERIELTRDSVTITDHSIEEPGTKRKTDFKDEYTRLDCVFWDFKIGDWSSKGCSVSSQSPAACQCDHLTNFAILVSRFEIPSDVTLSAVTYVGCSLSIIGLLLTLLVICLSRKLRNRYQMQILGNICLCLAIALLLFIFGVGSQVDTVNCTVLTVFMHFFFLAAWFWTATYSYIIYRDLVKVFATGTFKLRFAAIFAYGVPLLIVLLNSTIALAHVDDQDFLVDPLKQSSYRAQNFCWLHSHSLYFGFLLVVAILLVFNIAVFYKVIPIVTKKRSEGYQIFDRGSAMECESLNVAGCRFPLSSNANAGIRTSQQKKGIGKQVAAVVALVTTMGLSWLFGFLMLVSDNHSFLQAMSWLFTITNAFQGVFIFYFTAVRSGELRQLCAPINRRFTTTTTASTGVSSSEVRS